MFRMDNTDRLRKLYAEIRNYAIRMDPSMRDNFTANVRLMAGESLTPQAWVEGAKAAMVGIQRKLLESDTTWVTTTKRICYLRQTRTVTFQSWVSYEAKQAFVNYERSIWDGQDFQCDGVDPCYHMIRAIDSGD